MRDVAENSLWKMLKRFDNLQPVQAAQTAAAGAAVALDLGKAGLKFLGRISAVGSSFGPSWTVWYSDVLSVAPQVESVPIISQKLGSVSTSPKLLQFYV